MYTYTDTHSVCVYIYIYTHTCTHRYFTTYKWHIKMRHVKQVENSDLCVYIIRRPIYLTIALNWLKIQPGSKLQVHADYSWAVGFLLFSTIQQFRLTALDSFIFSSVSEFFHACYSKTNIFLRSIDGPPVYDAVISCYFQIWCDYYFWTKNYQD